MVDLGNGRGWLNPGPAASIARIDRVLGHPLQITEAGRSWAQQKAHWDTYQRRGHPIALHPDGPPKGNGPSVHQKGAAVDTDEGKRIVRFMEDHGWRRTVYRWVKGVWTLIEDWHWEYFERLDNHRFDAEPASTPTPAPVVEEEDEDMALKGAHYKNKAGTSIYMLFNEVSGFYVEHSGVDGPTYNNPIAQNWGTNTWPEITEGHAVVIKRSLDAIRRTAVTGSLSVDLS